MGWLWLSLLSAMSQAVSDCATKQSLGRIDEFTVSWGIYFFSFVMLVPICLFAEWPPIDLRIIESLAAVGILDTIGVILYVKALKSDDMSLTLPIQMFTPLFLLIVAPIMLGEMPTVAGLIGVLLIICGSYLINSRHRKQSLWAPFTAIWHQRGPRYMFFGAMIWSVTCSLHKLGVNYSSPLIYLLLHRMTISVALGAYLLCKRPAIFKFIMPNYRVLAVLAVLGAITAIFQLCAMQGGLAVYVISVKRTSVLLGIVLGAVLLKELEFRKRLLGATVMVAGVFCTAM